MGSAVNQDGRSQGQVAPNGSAQRTVIRDALNRAGLGASDVGYVEAHGTGTRLGDPVEVEALASVFAERDTDLLIGSVKSNTGHTEAAAGSTGLLKSVLALKEGQLPPTLHCQPLNRVVDWDNIPARVVQQMTDFPVAANGLRIAGVSAFGMSGTNVHMLLRAPELEREELSQVKQEEPAPSLGKSIPASTLLAGSP